MRSILFFHKLIVHLHLHIVVNPPKVRLNACVDRWASSTISTKSDHPDLYSSYYQWTSCISYTCSLAGSSRTNHIWMNESDVSAIAWFISPNWSRYDSQTVWQLSFELNHSPSCICCQSSIRPLIVWWRKSNRPNGCTESQWPQKVYDSDITLKACCAPSWMLYESRQSSNLCIRVSGTVETHDRSSLKGICCDWGGLVETTCSSQCTVSGQNRTTTIVGRGSPQWAIIRAFFDCCYITTNNFNYIFLVDVWWLEASILNEMRSR